MHAAITAGSDMSGHTSSGGAGIENFSFRSITRSPRSIAMRCTHRWSLSASGRASRLDTAGDQHTLRDQTLHLAGETDFAEDALGVRSRHRRRTSRRHGRAGEAYAGAGRGDHALVLVRPREAQSLAD